MQGQSILAGLRALVQQIDLLEQKSAQRQTHAAGQHVVVRSYSSENVYGSRNVSRVTSGRAAGIVQKLGVSQSDFARVAHAMGRDGHVSH